jgi:hypothetical protein
MVVEEKVGIFAGVLDVLDRVKDYYICGGAEFVP